MPGTAVSTAAQRRIAELVVVVLPGDCDDDGAGSGDAEEYGNNLAGRGAAEWLSYGSGPYDGLCARVLRPQRDLLRTALYGTRLLTRRGGPATGRAFARRTRVWGEPRLVR